MVLYCVHIPSTQSLIHGHLDCFKYIAVINNAEITVCKYFFILLKIYHQGKFIEVGCNFVRYCQSIPPPVVLVYILPEVYESTCCPTEWPTEYILILFNPTNSIGYNLYLNVVLIWISLIMRNILLNIFSYTMDHFYIFWGNCYLYLFPFFYEVLCFFVPQLTKGLFRHLFIDESFENLYTFYCLPDKCHLPYRVSFGVHIPFFFFH